MNNAGKAIIASVNSSFEKFGRMSILSSDSTVTLLVKSTPVIIKKMIIEQTDKALAIERSFVDLAYTKGIIKVAPTMICSHRLPQIVLFVISNPF